MQFLTARDVSLIAANELIGSIQGLKVVAKRSVRKIKGAFEERKTVALTGEAYYELYIDRIVMKDGTDTDIFRVLEQDKLEVVIAYTDKLAVFPYCAWATYEVNLKKGEPVLEHVVLFSGLKTEERE